MTTLEVVLIVVVVWLWVWGAWLVRELLFEAHADDVKWVTPEGVSIALLWPVVFTAGLIGIIVNRIVSRWREGSRWK